MSKHVLEKLAETNPDSEIWWDSSPLIYPSWKEETLEKAPEDRYQDADDFRADLNAFRAGEPVSEAATATLEAGSARVTMTVDQPGAGTGGESATGKADGPPAATPAAKRTVSRK